jgi:hypothetical protein
MILALISLTFLELALVVEFVAKMSKLQHLPSQHRLQLLHQPQ